MRTPRKAEGGKELSLAAEDNIICRLHRLARF
jgi:hypothetical protein